MIAMSHPTGNTNVRAVLAALDDAGLLEVFFTTVGVRSDGLLPRLLPEKLRRKVERRAYSAKHARVQMHPWHELLRVAGAESIDKVCFDLDNYVSAELWNHPERITGAYCYEDIARD